MKLCRVEPNPPIPIGIPPVGIIVSNRLYLCTCFQDGRVIASPYQKGSSGKERGVLANTHGQPKPSKPIIMAEELKQVADLITANTIFCTKEVLTSEETAKYLGISKSYLYKLTMGKKIPHYKPIGKMCYFNRLEVEQWLQSNRISTDEELEQRAQSYCMKKGGKR